MRIRHTERRCCVRAARRKRHAGAIGPPPHGPLAWSDMTPTNMPFERAALPRDDVPSPFICEKRVP